MDALGVVIDLGVVGRAAVPEDVTIKVAGVTMSNDPIAPGDRIFYTYNGTFGGPVEVISDINVYTSQRAIISGSFSEYPGIKILP